MYFKCFGHLSVGGSLTVQIFGSPSPRASIEEEGAETGDHLLGPDKQSGLSTSPVVVKLSEEASDILK